MRIVNEKGKKLRINGSLKSVVIMTFIILIIMIALPIIFLKESRNTSNMSSSGFKLNDENIVKSSGLFFPEGGKVKLYRREKNTVEELDLEEYIKGVVASEMPANFDEEALKAQGHII